MLKHSDREVVIITEGQYFRFLKKGSWEYVARNNCTGIVIILALTAEGKVLLTEQYRIPVGKNVIEFPAGLVSDSESKKGESLIKAAKRELLEETGYQARRMIKVTDGPSSGGASSDILTIFRAEGLKKVSSGGGDETEEIIVHEILLEEADTWIKKKRKRGCLVDPKIYAGLYLLTHYNK